MNKKDRDQIVVGTLVLTTFTMVGVFVGIAIQSKDTQTVLDLALRVQKYAESLGGSEEGFYSFCKN